MFRWMHGAICTSIILLHYYVNVQLGPNGEQCFTSQSRTVSLSLAPHFASEQRRDVSFKPIVSTSKSRKYLKRFKLFNWLQFFHEVRFWKTRTQQDWLNARNRQIRPSLQQDLCRNIRNYKWLTNLWNGIFIASMCTVNNHNFVEDICRICMEKKARAKLEWEEK